MSRHRLSRRVNEFVGVAMFAVALVWFIALATYNPGDPVWFFNTGSDAPPANFIGRVGAFLAELSHQLFGLASYLIPIMLAVVGWHYFWCRVFDALFTKAVGATLLFGCASSFLSLVFPGNDQLVGEFRAGGYVGQWLANGLAASLNRTGSIIFILTVLFLGLILSTQMSFGRLFATGARSVGSRASWLLGQLRTRRDARRRERQRQEVILKHLEKAEATATPAAREAIKARMADREKPLRAKVITPPAKPQRRASKSPTITMPAPPVEAPATSATGSVTKTPAERRNDSYTPPQLALLDAPRSERKIDERELMEGARLLEDKTREFSVEGSVSQIHPGPVVTTYEFKPDAGVKYSKITGLADDLSLAMRAESVLIERIPGKATVGIQIPNHNREQISLREMLESEPYTSSPSKLTLALGKTIHGEPFVGDLATMPHLLIAGSTGTGKSVAVNAMLSSILYRATPEDVRMVMIDPKRLELGMYDGIPHLMTPVVVEPKLASNALRWAVREMEERYKTLASFGVRNIEQYNRNLKQLLAVGGGDQSADEPPPTRLPYVVIVIDELADLMMLVGNDVEESIARLAQMARAVGIHLILATQRPSVDVLTGLIKANLPARISFRVSSKVDSRTILDGNGAEQLLGKGDMLYLPPASSRFIRLHGPYISEQETARLASFLRKQGQPNYDESITAEDKPDEAIEFAKDELYDQAARIVVSQGQASISYLQRRLRIGFSRAARLIDMMEADGLVSTGGGGKARELLVPTDYFEQVDLQLR